MKPHPIYASDVADHRNPRADYSYDYKILIDLPYLLVREVTHRQNRTTAIQIFWSVDVEK